MSRTMARLLPPQETPLRSGNLRIEVREVRWPSEHELIDPGVVCQPRTQFRDSKSMVERFENGAREEAWNLRPSSDGCRKEP